MKKVAFITGAGGFLGSEIAVTLAKGGIAVAICDINQESVDKAIERVAQIGGEAEGYVSDVADSKSITDAVNSATQHFGGLDILVNVAGGSARIVGGKHVPLVEQEDWVIDGVIKANLYGVFYASRAAAKIMIKQGRGGKIINFSSAAGINGVAGCCEYAAAKGGVMSLTKALAKELGPYKINVNAVAPGVVMRPWEDGGDHRTYKTNVFGEKCSAEDVANLVEFLASDKSRFITGQTCICDGGRTLSLKGTD